MKKIQPEELLIRLKGNDEPIPYELLLDADPSKSLVDRYLTDSELFIARMGEEIIGCYVLYPVSPKVVEIKNIAVRESYQGRGLGTILLRDIIEKARHNGYQEILIGTSNASVGQLYLYQKLGFEINSIRFNFFTENYPEPLFENGLPVKHMILLVRRLRKEDNTAV